MTFCARHGHQRIPDLQEMPLSDLLLFHVHLSALIKAEHKLPEGVDG
jgi:hypothetical protein